MLVIAENDAFLENNITEGVTNDFILFFSRVNFKRLNLNFLVIIYFFKKLTKKKQL